MPGGAPSPVGAASRQPGGSCAPGAMRTNGSAMRRVQRSGRGASHGSMECSEPGAAPGTGPPLGTLSKLSPPPPLPPLPPPPPPSLPPPASLAPLPSPSAAQPSPSPPLSTCNRCNVCWCATPLRAPPACNDDVPGGASSAAPRRSPAPRLGAASVAASGGAAAPFAPAAPGSPSWAARRARFRMPSPAPSPPPSPSPLRSMTRSASSSCSSMKWGSCGVGVAASRKHAESGLASPARLRASSGEQAAAASAQALAQRLGPAKWQLR
eukprot:27182-Chlamydomonas_euryale.AAC.1